MITLKQLLTLNKTGFPLVALKKDSETPAIRWSDVYNHPEYWTDERLREKQDLFHNVATTFGMVKVNDKLCWLNCADIDGKEAIVLLKVLIEELKTKTFVVNTRKGYHVYWLSSVQNPAIGQGCTKKGYEFEIKTDNSCGLTNLPPSVHRKDSKFHYTNVGKNTIMHDDTLYGKLLEQLKEYIIEQTKSNNSATHGYEEDLDFGDSLFETLNDDEINEIVDLFKPYYVEPHRHKLNLRIGGCFFHTHKAQVSAEQWITVLHDVTGDKDKLEGRLRDIQDTYQKGTSGGAVYGLPSLTTYLEEIIAADPADNNDIPKVVAEDIVSTFYRILNNASIRVKQAKEQKQKQKNNAPVILSPIDLLHAKPGLYQTTGQILGRNSLYKMILKISYECTDCGGGDELDYTLSSKKKPIYHSPIKEGVTKCETKECKRSPVSTLDISNLEIEAVDIELGDHERYTELEKLSVKLLGEDTRNIVVGEVVTIVGYLFNERKDGSYRNKLEPVLYAKSIHYSKREEIQLTQQDIMELENWKTSILVEGKEIIPELVNKVNPRIVGYENAKEAGLMALTSVGVRNDQYRTPERIRIHVLFIGDPSTAKSTMLRSLLDLVPNSGLVAGQSTTGLSLSAQVTKEEGGRFTIRQGPIAMHNNSVLGINEFNQLPISDHPQLLDYMEEGRSRPSKYAVEFEVLGNVVFIFSANPTNNEWDDDNQVFPHKEFGTTSQILWRIDDVQVFREPKDELLVKKAFKDKREADKIFPKEVMEANKIFLRKALLYTKTFSPTVSESLQIIIDNFVAECKAKGVPYIWSVKDSILRKAIARARLKFKHIVEEVEVWESITIYNRYLDKIGRKVIKASKNPRDTAYKLIRQIVVEQTPISLIDAVKQAMEKDSTIKDHLMELTESLALDYNYRLKEVVGLLKADTEILLSGKPIILKYKSKNNNVESESDAQTEDNLTGVTGVTGVGGTPRIVEKTVVKPESEPSITHATHGTMMQQTQNSTIRGERGTPDTPDCPDCPDNTTLEATTRTNSSSTMTILEPSINKVKMCPLPDKYIAFDFEWDSPNNVLNKRTKITGAAFADGKGFKKALHISDFKNYSNPERQLLLMATSIMSKYDCLLGWHSILHVKQSKTSEKEDNTDKWFKSVDSDLVVLHSRCKYNDVSSPVSFNQYNDPSLKNKLHIDLGEIYSKQMFMDVVYKGKYRTSSLGNVSKGLLGIDVGGKYKDISGKSLSGLSIEEQKKYNLRDAELTLKLAEYDNYNLLNIMKDLAEIMNAPYDNTCHTNATTWWKKTYRDMPIEAFNPNASKRTTVGKKFMGGLNLDPKCGYYEYVYNADVVNMYPSIAIKYNISHDTVNCLDCKNDPEAQVNSEITKDCLFAKKYWTCEKHKGAFVKKLEEYKSKRLYHKAEAKKAIDPMTKLMHESKSSAYKIKMNSGYGAYGSKYFDKQYRDFRVAELITAIGRNTLTKIKDLAESMKITVLYGDTDSLFVSFTEMDKGDKTDMQLFKEFEIKCNAILDGIEIETDTTYSQFILVTGKHYIGLNAKDELIIKGMEGIKSDRPEFVRNTFRRVIDALILQNTDPRPIIRKSLELLESRQIPLEQLQSSQKLGKNPEKYDNLNERKRVLGLKYNLKKGDLCYFYETDDGWCDVEAPEKLSIKKIKEILHQTISYICAAKSYPLDELNLVEKKMPKVRAKSKKKILDIKV